MTQSPCAGQVLGQLPAAMARAASPNHRAPALPLLWSLRAGKDPCPLRRSDGKPEAQSRQSSSWVVCLPHFSRSGAEGSGSPEGV